MSLKARAGSIFIWAFALTLPLALAPAGARAAALVDRVAIAPIGGPGGPLIRDAVESALLRSCLLVPTSAFEQAATDAGVALKSDPDFGVVAKALRLEAIVTGTVMKHKHWQVELVVRRADGQPVSRFAWSDPAIESIAAAIARMPAEQLYGSALAHRTVAAPVPASPPPERILPPALTPGPPSPPPPAVAPLRPAPSAPPRSQSASSTNVVVEKASPRAIPAAGDRRPSPPIFQVGGGLKMFSRTLSYTDNRSELPAYRLKAGSAVILDMAIHPFASGDSPLRQLALQGQLSHGMGVATAVPGRDGIAQTEVNGYEVGLSLRIPRRVIDIIPRASFMGDNFVANLGALSPDVRYRVVRLGVGFQMGVGRGATVRAAGDYLKVLTVGPMSDRVHFPRATAGGVDVQLGAGYELGSSIELQANAGLRRYAFSMHAKPGDSPLAGGAIDEYLSMTLGFAFRPAIRSR